MHGQEQGDVAHVVNEGNLGNVAAPYHIKLLTSGGLTIFNVRGSERKEEGGGG